MIDVSIDLSNCLRQPRHRADSVDLGSFTSVLFHACHSLTVRPFRSCCHSLTVLIWVASCRICRQSRCQSLTILIRVAPCRLSFAYSSKSSSYMSAFDIHGCHSLTVPIRVASCRPCRRSWLPFAYSSDLGSFRCTKSRAICKRISNSFTQRRDPTSPDILRG